ncbi:MAG: phosphatase PAP2 family protein [Motilibacteraceae bacterium]
MDSLVVVLAQDLLYVVALVAAGVWLLRERPSGRIELAVAAVVALLVAVVLVKVAGAVHSDPRPFVQNPSLHPLFPHPADDGFPSDHSTVAMAIAVVVAWRHRVIGAVLALCAVVIGLARVAAHVHHLQDVVAGWVLGAVAGAIGLLVASLLVARFARGREVRAPWDRDVVETSGGSGYRR